MYLYIYTNMHIHTKLGIYIYMYMWFIFLMTRVFQESFINLVYAFVYSQVTNAQI